MSNMTFEKALEELEGIVAKLEKGGTSLNESLSLFEKGVKLSRYLRTELDKAEKKVQILNLDKKDEKGEPLEEEFAAEDDEENGGRSGKSGGNDDDVPF